MNWTWAETGAIGSVLGFFACLLVLYFFVEDARSNSWSAEDWANFIRLVQLTFFLFVAMCYFGDVM